MNKRLLLAVLLAATTAAQASSHDLEHSVTSGKALVVQLYFADNTKFSYEKYEIYRPGEKIAFQVGRTDHLGRIIFIPDKSGAWRIRAFSEDGHGADFTVDVDAAILIGKVDRTAHKQYTKIFVGVGYILGIFGVISLFYRRRKT